MSICEIAKELYKFIMGVKLFIKAGGLFPLLLPKHNSTGRSKLYRDSS